MISINAPTARNEIILAMVRVPDRSTTNSFRTTIARSTAPQNHNLRLRVFVAKIVTPGAVTPQRMEMGLRERKKLEKNPAMLMKIDPR